jgi:2'-5' RNA ligase
MSLFPEAEEKKEIGRYYIAAIPPEPYFSRLWQVKRDAADKYKVKGGLFSPPHVTLTDDFYLETRHETELIECVQSVANRHLPLSYQLYGFMKMGPKAIAISHGEIGELKAFREDLRNAMNVFFAEHRVPLKLTAKFAPHLTILYRGYSDPSLDTAWEDFKDQPFEESFLIDHISILKHNGKTWDEWIKIPLNATV